MRKLIHEIWECTEEEMVLHTCCLAGPRGEECRLLMDGSARLLTTFKAGSHFEAMTFYNRYLGREKYTTNPDYDHEQYPAEWHNEQQSAGSFDAHKATRGEKNVHDYR